MKVYVLITMFFCGQLIGSNQGINRREIERWAIQVAQERELAEQKRASRKFVDLGYDPQKVWPDANKQKLVEIIERAKENEKQKTKKT